MGRFAAQVGGFRDLCVRRQEAIIKTAAQRLAEHVQTPKPKGGKLPVDTSFLRQSFVAKIGEMPIGPGDASEGLPQDWESSVTLVISGMEAGDVLYMGWTASYAQIQEEANGFQKDGVMSWQGIVSEAVRDVRARVK